MLPTLCQRYCLLYFKATPLIGTFSVSGKLHLTQLLNFVKSKLINVKLSANK